MKIVQADAGSESHKEYSGSWFSAYFGKAYKGIKSLLNRNGGSQDNPMNENTRKICDVLTFEQELGIFGLDPKSIRSRIGELSLERPEIAEKYINLKKEAGFNIVKDFPLAIPSNGGNGHAQERKISLPDALSEYAALGKVLYSDAEPLLLENRIVKTRSMKKHAELGKDRYSISDSIWERLKDYGEKDIATELMTIKGVGFKRAAKILSKNGKQVDEDALRKLYRKGKKVVNYQTTDDFCSEEGLKAFESKYSRSDVHITEGDDNLYASGPASEKSEDPIEENILELTEDDVYVEPGASYSSGPRKRPMDEEILELAEKPEEEEIIELTEVYDEPQDRKSQTVYQGISKEMKDFIKSHPEELAKGLMSVKDIEYKDVPEELREFYKELGMEMDISDSQIHEWYREMRKEHVKEGKWQIYDKFDEWAKAFVGTGEFSKETRGHLIRKK